MVTVLAVGCAVKQPSGQADASGPGTPLVAKARTAAEAGEYHYALELLLEALEDSEDVNVARQASQLAVAVEDWDAAARAASRWLELAPGSEQGAQVALLAALRRGESEAAVDILVDDLVGSASDAQAAWLTATELLAQSGDPATAEQVLEAALARAGPDAAGFADYVRSRFAARSGQPDRAYPLAERAFEAAPGYERAMWAARLAQSEGRSEQALAYFRQAASDRPDDRAAIIGQVQILRELDRPEEALEVLGNMPDDAELLYTRGILEQELGRAARAGATWQRLASLSGEQAGPRKAWLTGLLAELLEMPEEAVIWYARVEGQLESRADLRRASVLAGMGETEAARRLLADVRMQASPETKERAWLLEGRLLADHGEGERAVELLSEALTQLPGSESLLYARAMAAVDTDQLSLAEQDLRAIIQDDPENAIALNALGYTLSDGTDRQREALRLIQTALELEPDNPAILDSMGWVLFKLGRPEEALEYVERAAELDPHPEIVSHLIEVLWTLDQSDRAREWVARVREDFAGEAVFEDTLDRIGLE